MRLVLAPPLSDHMLLLPRSPRLPRGSRLESPCQVFSQDLQLHKALDLNYRALRGAFTRGRGANADRRVYVLHLHLRQDLPVSGARAFNYGDVNKRAAPLVSELSPGVCFLTGSCT